MISSIFCGPGITCANWVGVLTIVMAFVIFVGSIYLILAAVFGPRMGYLVVAVAFFGWMIIFSSLWAFGFFSQGPTTKNNLGPRGTEPHWQALAAGVAVSSPRYPVVSKYPDKPWFHPTSPEDPRQASVGTMTTAVQEFMAERANEQLVQQGKETEEQALSPTPLVATTDFTVSEVAFTTAGKTSLSAARVVFNGGGPSLIVFAYHDSGNVPVYSYSFLAGSILGFAIHLPFLDRAERRRKAVLTGGRQPQWLGPA
jgi:hypothetical protein